MNKIKNTNKGITLIALVITIIVMLILVAVAISMAVNGGLFDYAGKATGEMQNAINEEQDLASGEVTIGNTTYNSIDEYLGTSEGEDESKEKTYVEITELSVGDYISGYPVNYENVGSYVYNGEEQRFPDGEFENKWRVLSTTGGVVRIVSAGIPLSYNHTGDDGAAAISVENLTTNFLTTEINSTTSTEFKFYKCGFENVIGTNLGSTFANDYTDKVQALTKEDIDGVIGFVSDDYTNLTDAKYGKLLVLTSSDSYSGFASTVLGTGDGPHTLVTVSSEGTLSVGWSLPGTYGVRPVVTLSSNVKFSKAATKINETTTWEVSIPESE